jgi:DNA ligase-1
MNSNDIYQLLERIAADSKKTAKEAMLGEHVEDETLRRVLELALNPFKTYGVKALPTRTGSGDLVFEERHWRLLEDLRTRELTGGAARAAIADALNGLSPESAQVLSRILKKDLRAGFSANTTNKVFPKLIPEFAYMRCSLPTDVKLAEWPWADGVGSQEKADGMFANVDVDSTGVSVRTRQGNEIPLEALGELPAQMAKYLVRNHQHHGEVLIQRL